MTRLRVEPNARGFHVRSRDDDGTAKNFHLLPGLAIDVCDPVGNSVFIHKNIFRQSVGAEFEIPGSFGERQETPRRGEKGAGVTSGRTRTAKVTCGMAGVIHGELRDAVMKIRDTNLFRALLQDVVETTEIERRQILAVGVARPVLDRA